MLSENLVELPWFGTPRCPSFKPKTPRSYVKKLPKLDDTSAQVCCGTWCGGLGTVRVFRIGSKVTSQYPWSKLKVNNGWSWKSLNSLRLGWTLWNHPCTKSRTGHSDWRRGRDSDWKAMQRWKIRRKWGNLSCFARNLLIWASMRGPQVRSLLWLPHGQCGRWTRCGTTGKVTKWFDTTNTTTGFPSCDRPILKWFWGFPSDSTMLVIITQLCFEASFWFHWRCLTCLAESKHKKNRCEAFTLRQGVEICMVPALFNMATWIPMCFFKFEIENQGNAWSTLRLLG